MELSGLTLVLTNQCNMRCSYCYQTARAPRRMSWPTLRSALDFALRTSSVRFNLLFYGGEPLLRFAEIRRAVRYLASRSDQGKEFRFKIITNGLLLTPAVAEFLEEHDFRVVLSFDGPGAQAACRGDTFEILDLLLERLRLRNPKLFQKRLHVLITLTPGTVLFLGASVDYFLEKGVARITVVPAISYFPGWGESGEAELEAQFERVFRSVETYRDQTGRNPLVVFRPTPGSSEDQNDWQCGAARVKAPTVDVDGQLYRCPVFARSLQSLEMMPPFMAEAPLGALGKIEDPHVDERLATAAGAGIRHMVFAGRSSKRSQHSRCADCPIVDRCLVCPVSAAYIPGNRDPSLISDFACAFYRAAVKYHHRLAFRCGSSGFDQALRQLREWLDDGAA